MRLFIIFFIAILFLDEPTSGLDARTSLSVVSTLADLAHNHNHIIVCTIHQPRSQAFMKFDKLLLLAVCTISYSKHKKDNVTNHQF